MLRPDRSATLTLTVTVTLILTLTQASPPTEALRNAMRLVPRPLNGRVFDTALELSLTLTLTLT